MDALRTTAGFLGTGASMLSDLTLLAYVFLLVPGMVVGFVFARRKMFEPYHKWTMTLIVIFNWILILILMAVSYSQGVAPNVPDGLSEPAILIPTIHLIVGGLAQILATYLVLRMWLENVLPEALKVKNIKLYMRMTLAGWLVTALLGVVIYVVWYTPTTTAEGGDELAPVATEEAGNSTDADIDGADVPDPAATEEITEEDAGSAPVETEEASTNSGEDPTEAAPEPAATEQPTAAPNEDDAVPPVETEEVGS